MANLTLPIWMGSRTSYDAIGTKQPDIMYYVLEADNTYRSFFNGKDINMRVQFVPSLPATGIAGVLYVDLSQTPNPGLKYWTGSAYAQVGGDSVAPEVMEYMGGIDASDPTSNPYWTNAKNGNMFIVTTAGTISTVTCFVGDWLIVNKDVTGTPQAADFDRVPNPPLALENNLTTTTPGSALDATQGKALKDMLDQKMALVTTATAGNIAVYGAGGQVVDNSVTIATSITDSASNSKLASEKAVADALVFGTF